MAQPQQPPRERINRASAGDRSSPTFDTEPFRARRQRRLTIGELARRAGIGVEAVRYYQKRGLLEQPERPSQGFRVYPEQALERLAFIRRARDIGFSVDAVGDLLQRRADRRDSCDEVRPRFVRQIETFEAAIRELEAHRQIVLELLHACEQERADSMSCHTLEAFYRGDLGRPSSGPP